MRHRLNEMTDHEAYILARFLYRCGTPMLSDATYDELHEMMIESGDLQEYTSRTYDDDPIPMELLNKHGFVDLNFDKPTERDTSFLVEDKSKSIRSVTSIQQVFEFCQRFRSQRKVLSVKMDGNNIKSEVDDGELKLSLTRGRASNGIDVTDAMSRLIPKNINLQGRRVVVGEVFLPPEHLGHIREKYNGEEKYKTSKSAAISMIRRPQDHAEEDYRLLDFRVFACDGLSTTVAGTYVALEKLGFNIPPYLIVDETPDTLDEFTVWFTDHMEYMWEDQIKAGLPADGLVLELDDHTFETEIKDQYDERQIAIKFGRWKAQTYQGIITSIIVEQRRVFCSVRVTIEPLITVDGTTAMVINMFNPSYILDANLTIGSEIEFERNSGAVNILIGGKRVKTFNSDVDYDE